MDKDRFLKHCRFAVMAAVVLWATAPGVAETPDPPAAERIAAAASDPYLRPLLAEVLQRNPTLARLEAEARASEQRTPQVRALPDPTASLTWFLMPPQTRVGPQRAAVSISQRVPWFGSLKYEEQAALWDAVASQSEVEAAKIELLTATRIDYAEIQFLEMEAQLVREDRATLAHYAELALARYASGVGTDQAVIKIQAEITRTDTRLLEVAARRASVAARINSRRDRPQTTPVVASGLARPSRLVLDLDRLRRTALSRRPEVAVARARVEGASARVERSKKAYSPELVVGLNYGYVSRRDDQAGRIDPPEDNGQDVFGISGGLTVPLWTSSLEAGVEEGSLKRLAAEQGLREIAVSVDAELGDLVHRVPLLEEQMQLYDEVLLVQASQSLNSAEAAYAAGTAGALDLLDSERVLVSMRIAAARVRADLVMARARLEGAVAGPLEVER